MHTIKAFQIDQKTFSVTVSDTSSTSVSIGATVFENIRIVNGGDNIAFISVGVGSQTATTPTGTGVRTCTAVLPGSVEIFSLPRVLALEIAAICNSGETTILYIQVGEGI